MDDTIQAGMNRWFSGRPWRYLIASLYALSFIVAATAIGAGILYGYYTQWADIAPTATDWAVILAGGILASSGPILFFGHWIPREWDGALIGVFIAVEGTIGVLAIVAAGAQESLVVGVGLAVIGVILTAKALLFAAVRFTSIVSSPLEGMA